MLKIIICQITNFCPIYPIQFSLIPLLIKCLLLPSFRMYMTTLLERTFPSLPLSYVWPCDNIVWVEANAQLSCYLMEITSSSLFSGENIALWAQSGRVDKDNKDFKRWQNTKQEGTVALNDWEAELWTHTGTYYTKKNKLDIVQAAGLVIPV